MSHGYENRLWATLHLTHESLWIMVENGTKTCTFQVTMCKKWLGSEKVRRKLCSSQKEFHSQPFQAAELYTCGQNDSNGHVNFAWAIGDAKDERGSLWCLCRSRKYQPRFLAMRRERPHVSVLLGTFFDLQNDSDGWWDHTLVWSWSLIFIRMSPQHFQNWWTKGGSFVFCTEIHQFLLNRFLMSRPRIRHATNRGTCIKIISCAGCKRGYTLSSRALVKWKWIATLTPVSWRQGESPGGVRGWISFLRCCHWLVSCGS